MSDKVRETRAAARKGDTNAMIQIAEWHYIGAEGLEKSHIKSFEWLLKAAENGNAGAQNGVGGRYELGDGVAKDLHKAFDWYQKAFKGGDADACFNLALMLEDGEFLDHDPAMAARFYEEGAARGSIICQYRLGIKLLYGHGVRQDVPRAMEFLEFAGQGGYGGAYETLGNIYLSGEYVPRDPDKACEYYMRALAYFDSDLVVQTGNVPILYAVCLATGTGCTRDRKGAKEVIDRAAEAGNPIAEQVARDYIVRDPSIYDLFLHAMQGKPPTGAGWDISTILLSKFA